MILFARHAESEWNARFSTSRIDPGLPDPPLTARGREQAQLLARRLAAEGVVRLITSPYRRALETALIVAQELGVPLEVEPLVRERFAFTCDIGTPASRLRREFPRLPLDHLPEYWWSPRVESDGTVRARIRQLCRRLAADSGPRPLAVISHWGFLRVLTGRPLDNAELVRLDWHRFVTMEMSA